jgi:hypothetical protein
MREKGKGRGGSQCSEFRTSNGTRSTTTTMMTEMFPLLITFLHSRALQFSPLLYICLGLLAPRISLRRRTSIVLATAGRSLFRLRSFIQQCQYEDREKYASASSVPINCNLWTRDCVLNQLLGNLRVRYKHILQDLKRASPLRIRLTSTVTLIFL